MTVPIEPGDLSAMGARPPGPPEGIKSTFAYAHLMQFVHSEAPDVGAAMVAEYLSSDDDERERYHREGWGVLRSEVCRELYR